MAMMIYVHIPFCARKCAYCDFFSVPYGLAEHVRYFNDLKQEISESVYAGKDKEVSSIFFGGGTPSIVSPNKIREILDLLKARFTVREDAEITMEMNPGTVECDEQMREYMDMGINRLSIGLQSPNNEMLKKIGRIHTYEQFLKTYESARRVGFRNINVDLISALPGETLESFEKGLIQVASLSPEHISVYSLIVAENTPFYALYGDEGTRREELPSEEEDREMYENTEKVLSKYGYGRYEISNYAKKGFECRHNVGYWTHVPYVGFGAASASFLPETDEKGNCTGRYLRFKNPEKLTYIEGPYEDTEILEKEDLKNEYMMLKLRMTEGVSESEFEERFGEGLTEAFGDIIEKFIGEGLLEQMQGYVRLTKKGLNLGNIVFEAFV